MYTIRSTSPEGVYYLVNGWNKHKTFWVRLEDITPEMLFKRIGDAKASLTKLLKIMSDYKNDRFEVVSISGNQVFTLFPFRR